MASRLLVQLDTAIDAARIAVERDRLRAERAGVLARHGNIGQSRRICGELRSRSTRVDDPALAIWLALADGMAEHYESFSPRARTHFMRAHALARAAGLVAQQALSAAWLAIVEWNYGEPQTAADRVAEALSLAAPTAHSARARAGLVAADIHDHADEPAEAQRWFEHARDHANAEGDTSMISTLLYNRAMLRVCNVHLDDAFGLPTDGAAARALLEAESSGHFDTGVGTASLKDAGPIVRAQALVVNRRFEEALAIYEKHSAGGHKQGFACIEPRLRGDIALCRMRLGHRDAALADARRLLAGLDDREIALDDRAAALARAAEVFTLAALPDEAAVTRERADEALAAFRARQAELSAIAHRTIGPAPASRDVRKAPC